MIIFSDLHLRESSEQACLAVLGEIGRLAGKTDQRIVFCGDFWHIRYQVPVRLLNLVANVLHHWGREGLKVDFLPGNHDQVDVSGRNALEVFQVFRHVRVWTEVGIDEASFGFVPYRKDPAEVQRMLAGISKCSWIFAHFGVGGSLMNSGHTDQSGFAVPSGLPPLILGHYHKHQKGPPFLAPDGVVTQGSAWQYVGSPYQTSFGEAGNVCGCLDLRDGQWPVFVPLNLGLPEHHIVTWDPAVSETPPPNPGKPGDRVRLDVKASQEMIVSGKFANVLRQSGLGDVQVNVVPVAVAREHRFAVQSGESLVQAAGRFVQERFQVEDAERAVEASEVMQALGRWT